MTDLKMPMLDGLGAMARIREDFRAAFTPIASLTGNSSVDSIVAVSARAGCQTRGDGDDAQEPRHANLLGIYERSLAACRAPRAAQAPVDAFTAQALVVYLDELELRCSPATLEKQRAALRLAPAAMRDTVTGFRVRPGE